jgi:hypothetical protein
MPASRRSARPGFIRLLLLLTAGAAAVVPGFVLVGQGGGARSPVAPGVTVRQHSHRLSGIRVIDADLSAPGIRVEVAADEIAVRQGRITGRARTLPEWLQHTGASAGINGGFFGETVGEHYKEIVGLLKRDERVRSAAPVYRARPSGRTYARSAFGVSARGRPSIAWVTSAPGRPQLLRSHAEPEFTGGGAPWEVEDAVACGPRLIRSGRVEVSYRGERLASPGALPRTFIGYGGPPGKQRAVLCAAEAMEFADCAAFLMDYFRGEHGVPCSEAMALDGGASTQAAWRERGRIAGTPGLGVTVPTAILIYAR